MCSAHLCSNVKTMWTPNPKKWTQSDEFRNLINVNHNVKLDDYFQLYKWSCDNYPKFWEEFWHFSKLVHSNSYEKVIDLEAQIDEIPDWFPGSTLNYAQNLLRSPDGDKVALYATGEGQCEIRKITFKELRVQVSNYASAMKRLGITKGDRIVGYIPNCIEAVEAMLAAASLGAIWSSTSPDFGITGVLERFYQIKPKLLFSVAAVVYNGKRHGHVDKLVDVVRGLSELEKVVLVPFANTDRNNVDVGVVPNGMWLDDFLLLGLDRDGSLPELDFVQVPFSHPLFIMYSSGTTGVPKCMVHSCGGTLIQHLKEHILQGNTTSSDTVMYYTTTGWMMWNWLVSALATGASIVLYDGSPLAPSFNVLWDLIDTLEITIFGTGAKWLSLMEEHGIHPIKTHKLKSLTTILSTGSPLKPQSYDYVYDKVKSDLLLGSISGGTDIIASFMGHSATVPVHRGEIQCALLAMAIECWNDEGRPVVGERGELVCLKPHPSMPTRFWNDPDRAKYRKAYFSSHFKGVWRHGDYCLINPKTQGLVMLGRSDGTLNPNGVRFGSAEIYNLVESFAEIEDSLCVAQLREGQDERVVLFVKMASNSQFGQELVQRLRETIRTKLSVRHVPASILETTDIPVIRTIESIPTYTINGKKVEVAVRDVISGRQVANRSVLRNPESLDLYANMRL